MNGSDQILKANVLKWQALKRFSFRMFLIFVPGYIVFLHSYQAAAQCGSSVPSYTVNLVGHPDSTWTTPTSVSRSGNCCTTSSPIRCIHFTVSLDPTAAGIVFDLSGGAGGTTYYINCVSGGRAGTPQCLTGTGPWDISFCKSGSNPSLYTITSVSKPYVPYHTLYITNKCSARMVVKGLDESTITWTALTGSAYNSNLSCTSGCDTTYVSSSSNFPSYVDYKVCGTPLLPCYASFCDTIRVYYESPLKDTITASPAAICYGSTNKTLTVTASGGKSPYTYLWSTGDTTSSINVTAAGTYSVIVNDSLACSPVYDTVTVVKLTTPIGANAGSNKTICSGTSASIGRLAVVGYTYSWKSSPSGFTSTSAQPTVSPTTTTVYTVTVTNSYGCTDSSSATITVNALPAAAVASDTSICSGASLSIGAASVSGSTYSWSSSPAGFSSTSANPTVSPTMTTTYTLTETNSNGCVKSNSVTITVNPLPAAAVRTDTTICAGSTVALGAASVSGSSYGWASAPSGFSAATANPTASPSATTTYTNTETNSYGCVRSNNVTITVNPLPAPSISGNNAPCELGAEIYSTTDVSGDTYSWSVTGGTIQSGQGTHSISVDWGSSGTGTVTVTETNSLTGCTKTVSYNVTIYPRPGSKSILH